MASHLANIFGTEQDRVNCSFYYKIGACRHGDRCSRKHQRPVHSQTLVAWNVYQNPANDPGCTLSPAELQDDFDAFYTDMFIELAQFGNLLELHICDNVGDHLIGNVYARFDLELECAKACENLNGRWYAGKPLWAELSPVSDFREACCRQNDEGNCNRGGLCNFLHVKKPSPRTASLLRAGQRLERSVNPLKPIEDETVGWVPASMRKPSRSAADEEGESWKGGGGGGWREKLAREEAAAAGGSASPSREGSERARSGPPMKAERDERRGDDDDRPRPSRTRSRSPDVYRRRERSPEREQQRV